MSKDTRAAQAATAPVADALRAGDAAALRAALRYPGAGGPTATSQPIPFGWGMRMGTPMALGRFSLSFMELCYDLGRVDLFKIALEADHLAMEMWPSSTPEARRTLWQRNLISYGLPDDSMVGTPPLCLAINKMQPHTLDFLRVLIEFQEPDWGPLAADGAGAALLREVKMRMHIDARMGQDAVATDGTSQSAVADRQRARAL